MHAVVPAVVCVDNLLKGHVDSLAERKPRWVIRTNALWLVQLAIWQELVIRSRPHAGHLERLQDVARAHLANLALISFVQPARLQKMSSRNRPFACDAVPPRPDLVWAPEKMSLEYL